jgi:predicted RNA-binding protein with TRAM domain
MITKAVPLVATLTLALPGAALAEFSYDFLEGSFVDVEIDDTSINGDGIRIEGSSQISDAFFIRAEYEDYDFDFGIDGSIFELGGGYFQTLNETLDFVAVGQYVQVEVEDIDDDGLGIGGGLRTRFGDSIEADAVLNWVDLDNSGSDTYIDLRGRYYFNEQFAVTLKFELGSDSFDTKGIGARFNFR